MPYIKRRPSKAVLKKERPFVFTGAVALAAIAGFVNSSLLSFYHVPVSHMSGAVSRLSIDLGGAALSDLLYILEIFIGFFLGATLSGLIIGGRQLLPGRRYGVVLFVEGTLLCLSAALLLRGMPLGVAVAALACGAQNAMASSYYGLVIRTTHVTGIVTDLGVLAGHWLRHRRVRAWRVLLLLGILLGFFAGGVAGAVVVVRLGARALLLPAAACLLTGTIYYVWQHPSGLRARRIGA
jgi:uncharacterized membrane protein YoaK (UPF0700 family)